MSELQTQPIEMTATLELDDKACLSGELSVLPDGRLQLALNRLVRRPEAGGKPRLQPGTVARLTASSPGSSFDGPETSPVKIIGVTGETVTLEFREADGEASRRWHDSLRRGAHPTRGSQASGDYADILDALREQSLVKLEALLKPFLKELTDHLFDLSTQIRQSSSHQNIFYDATIAVRRKANAIATDTVAQVARLYDELTPADPDARQQVRADDSGDLNLIDTMEFESSLAIDRMITLGEDIYHVPLEALVIRLAVLIDADPHTVRLPVHVEQLSRAFQRVIAAQGYPAAVLLRILDYFTHQFMGDLEDYYSQLNRYLSDHGIRPGLEREIENKGSLLRPELPARPVVRKAPGGGAEPGHQETKSDPAGAAGPAGEERTGPAGPGPTLAETASAMPPRPASDSAAPAAEQARYNTIYKSVIDALNFKRAAHQAGTAAAPVAAPATAGDWSGSSLASTAEVRQNLASAGAIARTLGSLQHDAQVRAAVEQGSSLREYLSANKEHLGELRDTDGLTAESLNQLDLVDNLFGTIRSQLDVSAELRPALGDLHIPLAKLALLDPQFFLNRGHPARATVDKLAQLSTSANFPNKALEARITDIVDEIVADYENDNSVFEAALAKIDKLLTQQERALARNVERVVRMQEGQEKLSRAQQSVDRLIASTIKTAHTPRVLADLLDNGGRDLLVLTHIKEGPDSEAWREQIQTLELLGQWLSEQEQGEVGDDLMMQRGLEAGTLIELLEQQIAAALPTNVSHQPVLAELREILSGSRKIEFADLSDSVADVPPEPGAVRAKVEDLPRLRRWVMRVEQLEKNSWLTYRDQDGKKLRMQLAWISEERDRYIFVNERGQKVADLSAIQLARQLSKGMQPPAPADQLTVVDKSLYQTLEDVQKTLSFARNHDALTKLINRETFLDQMQRALRHAQRKHARHAVLYLNIDQFSLVNEVYDRVQGDQVLLEFARLLAQLHGKKTSSARIEADSFAVLLLDRSMEQAIKFANKIRQDIETGSVDIDGDRISFTVSIGVVPIVEHSPEVGELLNNARATMHHAKEQGRNRVVQYEEEQAVATNYARQKSKARLDLEQAVASDRFILQAQPIVLAGINTGVPVNLHYELLLGIADREGALASPEEFIASAERYGFMTLVDRWVVREAFSWISSLMDAQKVVPSLSINLSGGSVTDDSFMDYLFEQISEYGVGTSRICFEITETGTISNLVKAADFVRAFRNIGCKFSIDDFGTGLASHNYLRELPVDYVKIDGSFITQIHKNRNDYAIARSINDLAHFLGQETIAESVENEEIITKLTEIGVDYLQGWGVGRPKVLTEVAKDLSSVET